jgi:hypothetical protein
LSSLLWLNTAETCSLLWILMYKFGVRRPLVGVCIHKHNGTNLFQLTAHLQSTFEPIIASRRLNQWIIRRNIDMWLCGVMHLCCHSDSSLATKIRIKWPSRSPDLSAADVSSSWGYLIGQSTFETNRICSF